MPRRRVHTMLVNSGTDTEIIMILNGMGILLLGNDMNYKIDLPEDLVLMNFKKRHVFSDDVSNV